LLVDSLAACQRQYSVSPDLPEVLITAGSAEISRG